MLCRYLLMVTCFYQSTPAARRNVALSWVSLALLAVLLVPASFSFFSPLAIAAPAPVNVSPDLAFSQQTARLPLTALGVEAAAYLPGVRPERVIKFTRPHNWGIHRAVLELEFEHSPQLIDPSWLEVILNGKTLKHLALKPENVKGTKLKIDLPKDLLQDKNQLIVRVEQHYADTCEDPLNPSLWTNVLANRSYVVMDYKAKPAPLSFKNFPYPLVDPLNPKPTTVRFIIPNHPDATVLQAMARLNALLAQSSPLQEVKAVVQFGDAPLPNQPEPLILLSTPGSLRGEAAQLASKVPTGGAAPVAQLVNRANGSPALVLAGATPQALAQAVDSLVAHAVNGTLPATADRMAIADSNVVRPIEQVAPYVVNRNLTFSALGHRVQTVKMLTAAPIVYNIPVMTDFSNSGASLGLDLHYGFSAGLNPKFSSLELRLNDVAIANLPLTDVNGNENTHATVALPSDLLGVNNRLVAQFHLMPDKHGLCANAYKDTAWAKIYPDSELKVSGTPATKLPSLALLKQGYPYTQQIQLAQTRFVLSQNDISSVNTLLEMSGRFGRQASHALAKPVGSLLEVGVGDKALETAGDKHVVLISQGRQIVDPPGYEFHKTLTVGGSALTVEEKLDHQGNTALVVDNAQSSGWLDQGLSGNGHVLTRLAATSPAAIGRLEGVFAQSALLNQLPEGTAAQLGQGIMALKAVASGTPNVAKAQGFGAGLTDPKAPNVGWVAAGWIALTIFALFLIFGLFPAMWRLFTGGGNKRS
jgi:Bacterial cellulose synthase subunit